MKPRSDWLLNLRRFFAIHLQATRVGVIIVVGMWKFKLIFVFYYLTVLVYTKTTIIFSSVSPLRGLVNIHQ